MNEYYSTDYGKLYCAKAEEYLEYHIINDLPKVDLILTSPPFPLNRKKKYGNLQGQEYIDWMGKIAVLCSNVLKESGSIVIEIGNSWDKGQPTFSTLPMETLLNFKKTGNLELCQEFIVHNKSRLPTPIEWVNKRRIRVKDSFNKVWWLSKTPYPKADNRNVLVSYSMSMKQLLKKQKYNSGKRPSEHNIGEKSFLINNGGAIPSSVIEVSNTKSNTKYIRYCKENDLELHPARMTEEFPAFFIKFLTQEGDTVMDIFAGSNTTGFVAESLGRKWISVEINEDYVLGSRGRFNE